LPFINSSERKSSWFEWIWWDDMIRKFWTKWSNSNIYPQMRVICCRQSVSSRAECEVLHSRTDGHPWPSEKSLPPGDASANIYEHDPLNTNNAHCPDGSELTSQINSGRLWSIPQYKNIFLFVSTQCHVQS
jgi:hypothetical protein